VNLAESILKNSKLALTCAKLRSMHTELSYGLSFAPKLQRVGGIHISGSDQPTPDPSFSLIFGERSCRRRRHLVCLARNSWLEEGGACYLATLRLKEKGGRVVSLVPSSSSLLLAGEAALREGSWTNLDATIDSPTPPPLSLLLFPEPTVVQVLFKDSSVVLLLRLTLTTLFSP